MLRYFLAVLIFLHGLIHFMGFAKAFQYGSITALTRSISKPAGLLWLLATLLFLIAGSLVVLKKDNWWMPGLTAAVLSQVLILSVWQDAKYGTIANVLILLACVLTLGSRQFERRFRQDVAALMVRSNPKADEVLTENDILHLPAPVQRYLRYTGALHQPMVHNYRLLFTGDMRRRGGSWFPFTSEQYNFTAAATRLFFMKGKLYGVTVPGYHAYQTGHATMQISLFGLVPVVSEKEGVLNPTETVTLFNDMCLFAPATLADPSIRWKAIDDRSASARFSVGNNTISATLYFSPNGELVNFVSDDRYDVGDKKAYRFSTPVSAYRNYNGYRLPSYGEAVWHYPDGAFVYGRFHLQEVQYNLHTASTPDLQPLKSD